MSKGRPKLKGEIIAKVKELHDQEKSVRQIQKLVSYETRKGIIKNISLGSICNILKYSE